ncbi:MAG: hypothetical protein JWR83_3687 [Aeromicrobium sp.]|nr:hypothetical protein [Aeromicrobium sp.]
MFLVLLFASGTVRVTSPSAAPYRFAYGWPFDWVTQQSSLTPPLPYDIGLGNPMENPTDLHWIALAANIVLMWACLVAAALVTKLVWGKRTQGSNRN